MKPSQSIPRSGPRLKHLIADLQDIADRSREDPLAQFEVPGRLIEFLNINTVTQAYNSIYRKVWEDEGYELWFRRFDNTLRKTYSVKVCPIKRS